MRNGMRAIEALNARRSPLYPRCKERRRKTTSRERARDYKNN